MTSDGASPRRERARGGLPDPRPWRRWLSGSAPPEGDDGPQGAAMLSCAGDCRRLIESSIVGVVVGEFGGEILDVNGHFLDLTGYAQADLPLRWSDTIRSDDPAVEEARIQILRDRAEVPAWETVLVRKDGVQMPVLVAATRLGETDLGCVAFIVDLTRSREAEEAFQRSEALHRALFEHSPSLSLTLDREGAIVTVNTHGARKLGYERSELVGRSVFDFVADADRPGLEEMIRTVVTTPDSVAGRELRQRRRDGAILWTAGSLRSLPGTGGDEQLLLVCKDVTELKGTEQRLRAHRERLRVLTSDLALAEERERRRIATGLHDEVGHSLALAQIRLGMLERELGEGAAADLAPIRGLISEAIETVRSLTFDLSSPVLYEIGLAAAIQSVAERMSEATGTPFGFQGDGGPEPPSEDRRVLLFRCVREILLNVAKHARAGSVTVTLTTVGDEMRIVVADDGIGFDVSEVMAPAGRGVGHGLIQSVEQIQSIGGRLDVDSAPGAGTTYRIVAPLGTADADRTA